MELNGKQPGSNPEKNILTVEPEYWTSKRKEIYSWLDKNSASSAEMYKSAVRLMFEIQISGKIRLVSHCVREICNRLVNVKVGATSRFDYSKRISQLSTLWKKKGFSIDGILSASSINSQANLPSSSPGITIPSELFFEITNIIKEHEETSSKINERVESFFIACVPENELYSDSLRPLVSLWKKNKDWFERNVHDNGKVDAQYNMEELYQQFELFEQVLSTVSQRFYSTTDEIDAILQEANS